MKKRKIKVVERKLGRDRALGQCVISERCIEVDSRLKSKSYLMTLIHELLHILSVGTWSEHRIEMASREMAHVLWDKGFRRIQK